MYVTSKRLTFRAPAVIRLASPSSPTMKFHLYTSEEPVVLASGFEDFDVAAIEESETTGRSSEI